jgi:hypothetical protein
MPSSSSFVKSGGCENLGSGCTRKRIQASGYARRRWKRETTLVPCHTALSEFVILEVVGATTALLMFEQSNSVSVGSIDTPQAVRALLQLAPLFRVSELGLILAALLDEP